MRKLLLIGIFLIFFACSLIIISNTNYQNNGESSSTFILKPLYLSQIIAFVASLTGSAGITIVIIAIIETKYLRKTLEEASKEIVSKTSKCIVSKTSDKLDKTFEIISNCKYNGLDDILPPRQDEDKENYTRTIIAEEIKKAKCIYIFSISGTDFFEYPIGSGAGGGMYYPIIFKRLEQAKKDLQNQNNQLDLEIKALLINPKSKAAKIRNQIEELDISKGDIYDDVKVSIQGIIKLNKIFNDYSAYKNSFIDVRLYSEFPQVGFILTDSFVFLEPYHFAPTKEFCAALKDKNRPGSTFDNNCTGGRIPVFKFHKMSNMYIAMKKHFDFIWNFSEQDIDNGNILKKYMENRNDN